MIYKTVVWYFSPDRNGGGGNITANRISQKSVDLGVCSKR